jgi:predicted O-linked N-acetylglucosamine transferase (SPINDLY family)
MLEARRSLQAGEAVQAEQVCRDVLNAFPDYPDALNFVSVALARQGRFEEAERCSRAALGGRPNDPGILLNLGNRLFELGRAGEAAEAFAEADRLTPGDTRILVALVRALAAAGRREPAADAAEALAAVTTDPDLLAGTVDVLSNANRLARAGDVLQRMLAERPEQVDWWMRAAALAHTARRLEDAARACERVIALEPDRAEAWTLLASCKLHQRDFGRMREVLDGAPADPGEAANQANLRGMMLVAQARLEEGLEVMAATAELAPNSGPLQMTRLMYLNYDPVRSAAAIAAEHRAFGQRFADAVPAVLRRTRALDPARPLRVGFLSPDFRLHSVAYFLAPLLRALDREWFEPVAYANVTRPDAVTAQFQAEVALWRETAHLDDRALAELVAADGVDILIELAGLTRDSRLLACAGKPAPIQVSWLGYPNTTGLPQIDYRITDWIADPEGADDLYSEVLIRLPRCFLCYAAPERAPPVAMPPVIENGFATFGSFNNLAKVNRSVIGLWSEVLRAVPTSQLLMKATGTSDPAAQEHLREAFAAAGIAPERIRFAGYAPTPRDHLLTYSQVDIALDTFPYNGTTTTCEALWMGVPVVTLQGDRHASRVGASLLQAIGFTAGIAQSAGDYIETAKLLAQNPSLLAGARRNLRADLARSPLTDQAGFAAVFQQALRAVWEMHLTDERPER